MAVAWRMYAHVYQNNHVTLYKTSFTYKKVNKLPYQKVNEAAVLWSE